MVVALRKTADTVCVTDYRKGDIFRIADPDHQYTGKSGTLEFSVSGAGWLRIEGCDVAVSLNKLVLVRKAV
jgi:hypothetical protein